MVLRIILATTHPEQLMAEEFSMLVTRVIGAQSMLMAQIQLHYPGRSPARLSSISGDSSLQTNVNGWRLCKCWRGIVQVGNWMNVTLRGMHGPRAVLSANIIG
jgi:hypothetical protein